MNLDLEAIGKAIEDADCKAFPGGVSYVGAALEQAKKERRLTLARAARDAMIPTGATCYKCPLNPEYCEYAVFHDNDVTGGNWSAWSTCPASKKEDGA